MCTKSSSVLEGLPTICTHETTTLPYYSAQVKWNGTYCWPWWWWCCCCCCWQLSRAAMPRTVGIPARNGCSRQSRCVGEHLRSSSAILPANIRTSEHTAEGTGACRVTDAMLDSKLELSLLLLAASAAASLATSDRLLVILAFASCSRKPSLAILNFSASLAAFSAFVNAALSAFFAT